MAIQRVRTALSSSSPMSHINRSVLEHGGCTPRQLISDCYELSLSSNPTRQLDPGGATPRQRIEFLTAHQPGSLTRYFLVLPLTHIHISAGASWNYQWRSYVPSSVTGNGESLASSSSITNTNATYSHILPFDANVRLKFCD